MSTSDYDDLRPDRVRPVEVQPDTDGDWIPGDLEAIDKSDGVWRGYVRYSRGPGHGNHLGWFPEDQVRGHES